MDSLEQVIDEARLKWANALEPADAGANLRASFAEHLATAVRTWLVSEENVEAMARGIADGLAAEEGFDGQWELKNGMVDYIDQGPTDLKFVARAALTALCQDDRK